MQMRQACRTVVASARSYSVVRPDSCCSASSITVCGLYEVQAAPVLSGADPAIKTPLVSQADHAVLWHRRFGHAGHSTLAKMSRTDTVQGLPSPQVVEQQLQSTQVCTPCVEGKMKRESFTSSTNRASTKIEKLHVDLAGPFESSSGGANYYIVIVDDFSGYKIVKPLAKKSKRTQLMR